MMQQKTGRSRFGRPPRPPDEVRSERLVTYVTRPQLKELRSRAEHQGKSLSRLVYELLSDAIGRARRKEEI